MSGPQIQLIYDHECPVCRSYAQMLNIRSSFGEVELINARMTDHPLVQVVSTRGLDLDEGFVLVIDDSMHHGADAIHQLAMISTGSNFLNRLNAWVFKSPVRSRWLYPLLKAGRNILLAILGKKKIQQG